MDARTRDYLDAFLTTATLFKAKRQQKYFTPNDQRDLQNSINKIKTEEKNCSTATTSRKS